MITRGTPTITDSSMLLQLHGFSDLLFRRKSIHSERAGLEQGGSSMCTLGICNRIWALPQKHLFLLDCFNLAFHWY